MIVQYRILHQQLKAEWVNVRAAAEKAQAAYADIGNYRVDAAALNLQGFYSGIERLFEWIGRQIDGTIPQSTSWHRDLLRQMVLDVPGIRPQVIKEETAKLLDEYLGFRHVVRNLYSWDLNTAKVARLIDLLPQALDKIEVDLDEFGRFLQSAGEVDSED
ncbi:MAG: hypothetical protein DWQ04_16430 [Chloroflexi bacterium]|nr:MAG: hypothetical protein DWQ04_16430 [Chloroflexota bacterium]